MRVSLLTTEQHILNQRETYPLPSAKANGLKATNISSLFMDTLKIQNETFDI